MKNHVQQVINVLNAQVSDTTGDAMKTIADKKIRVDKIIIRLPAVFLKMFFWRTGMQKATRHTAF